MAYAFTPEDFDRLGAALGVAPVREGAVVRFTLTDAESGRKLVLEIQSTVPLPESLAEARSALVSAYGTNAFIQLQGVTGFLASEELGEVIFFARHGGTTSGLIVERGAGCSLYGHVHDRLLEADFTRLPPEVMMGAVALSLSTTLSGSTP